MTLGHELELSSDSFSTIKLTATKRIRGQIKRTETDTGSSAQRTSSPQCGSRAVNKLTAMRIRGQSQRHTQQSTKQNAINKQQTKYRPTANTADPRANRNITKMNTNVLTNNTHRKSELRV